MLNTVRYSGVKRSLCSLGASSQGRCRADKFVDCELTSPLPSPWQTFLSDHCALSRSAETDPQDLPQHSTPRQS